MELNWTFGFDSLIAAVKGGGCAEEPSAAAPCGAMSLMLGGSAQIMQRLCAVMAAAATAAQHSTYVASVLRP